MLFFYKIIINIIFFFSPLIILFRFIKKKEDPIRFKEKFCFFSKKRFKGRVIWFHGASVGELLSVIPLIEQLEKNKNISQILVTSNTLSSSKIFDNLKLRKTIHQFFPIDTNFHSKKFLEYWRPSNAIFVDSEIWPNMINNIKKKSISLILLNARITKKSFLRWKRFSKSSESLFKKFDACFVSNKESKKYLKLLKAKNINYIGNLKFSQMQKEKNIDVSLKKKFLSRKIWCATSTHNGEEKICGQVHKRLKKKYQNLLTIIIPRHIERVKIITDEMIELGLKVQIFDPSKKIKKDTDICLINSYGKTKPFFKICNTVFLGGSIIFHGGQNPLEPARYGCRILHGPNVWNFKEIYQMLNKYGVSNRIRNTNQLTEAVNIIFKNKKKNKKIKVKINKLGNKILDLTLKKMNLLINKK